MSLKLYEITEEIEALDGLIDSWASHNDGDLTNFPLNDELDRLKGERDEKLLNLAVWHKSLKAEAEAFKGELKRLLERQRVLSNKADRVKEFIDYNMTEGERLSDTRCALSYRKSTQVVIDCPIEELPKEVVKTTATPDKPLIKTMLKTGNYKFAHLQDNFSLQIK